MGLFSNIIKRKQIIKEEKKQTDLEKAKKYFTNEHLRLSGISDEDAIVLIFKTLLEDNNDTRDDKNMKDAVSSLDVNLYNLAKSVIYQNFMLMRKIDSLSDRIEKLETLIIDEINDLTE